VYTRCQAARADAETDQVKAKEPPGCFASATESIFSIEVIGQAQIKLRGLQGAQPALAPEEPRTCPSRPATNRLFASQGLVADKPARLSPTQVPIQRQAFAV